MVLFMENTHQHKSKTRIRAMKDQVGRRFGRLVVVALVEQDTSKENNHLWMFKCDCGNEKQARIKSVRSGKTSSCGCFFSEMMTARNTKHGLSNSSATYRTWKDMRQRCMNEGSVDWPNYGGRGITVCQEWDDFLVFLADMGERPHGMTLDRIDVNGNYSKQNCRWASPKTQANNKTSNKVLTLSGRTQTLQQWADETGIKRETISARLRIGMPEEKILHRGRLAPSSCIG
jgi:hypothetical protein